MIYVFGDCALDVDKRELRRGAMRVSIEPQVFDLLQFLLRNRSRVVSRNDLIEAVWNGRVISDSTVAARISAARKAVGDSGKVQSMILTSNRKGLRFIGDVDEIVAPIVQCEERSLLATEQQYRPAAETTVGERRQVTVLACALNDSAALAERLDPEDFSSMMVAFHNHARDIIGPFGGFVVGNGMGGLLIYFGYPSASERDVELAIRASLALVAEVEKLDLGNQDKKLQVRVGLATGLVVVSRSSNESDHAPPSLVGHTPLLAARLLELARPGQILVTLDTRRLFGAPFEFREIDGVMLNELEKPIRLFSVVGERSVYARLVGTRSGESRLVGRQEELDFLKRRWEQAKAGAGSTVLVLGEPGIGKSRLLRALQAYAFGVHQPALVHHCSPNHQGSVLHPFLARLYRDAGITGQDTDEIRLRKLEAMVLDARRGLVDGVPLLAAVMSIGGNQRHPPLRLAPPDLRRRVLQLLIEQIKFIAAERPLLIVFEDLQWSDPTSLEVISLLIEECKSTQLLIVASARSEFKPHWLDSSNVSRLWLNRLKPASARTIVDEVAGKNPLPSAAVDLILERADGVPLFIEELTTAIRESHSYKDSNDCCITSVLRARSIVPMTLDAALVARLDRLEGAKFLAQTAAVIGREFSYPLLVGLWPGSEQELRQALASLVSAQLIHPRGEPPHAVYRFKHALVRDAAYHMLLRSERQQLHLQTGKLLESSDGRIAASQPELVAHHFSEAGASGRAVRYWLAAGKNAIARSANREAVLHLKRGLAEIERLPTNERRAGEELELRLVLLPALIATEGISSADAVDTYKHTLHMNVGDESDASLHVLAGHCHVLYFRALHRTALAVAEDLLQRAKRKRNPTFTSIAHRMIGQVHNAFGDYRAGQTHCNRAYELAVKIELPEVDPRLISDVLVSACGHSAVSLWHVGEIVESLRREAIALERIGQIRHYQTSGFGAFSRAAATFRRRDFTPLLKYARALRSIGQEQNAPHWTAWGLCMEGIALTHAGDVDHGIMQIENGLDLCRRSDIQLMQPVFMGGLVEAYTVAGRYEAAAASLREAFSMSERTEERWMYAEYWRLRGDLALRSNSKKSDAEKAFFRGLAIADEQGSKTHALRLTTALARLLSATRRRQEAVQMLRSRLEALNEPTNVDVPDVKVARVLLDELS